jgi:beta-glucosidase
MLRSLLCLSLLANVSPLHVSDQPWMRVSDSPQTRANALISKMTLDQMVTLLHGVNSPGYTGMTNSIPELGVPSLTLNDGRQGFRPNDGSKTNTAFPCAVQVVATFDRVLMNEFGKAMAEEFVCKGSNVMLAPMLILARVPLDGRIFESIGADPELGYAFAYNMITGAQSVQGLIANADDFVLNNQESDRNGISAVCDERTLFELYYRAYKGAVDANVGSFMCSYNLINGSHACENQVTLGDLKSPQGLNFSGWVLSDWGGVHSTLASAFNGLDQEMPGSQYFGQALIDAVNAGQIPMSVIYDKVFRILVPMFQQGLFDIPSTGTQDTNCTSSSHTLLSRTIAAAGTVLLKNANNNVLPIDTTSVKNILVVGDAASLSPQCCGAGSGFNNPPYIVSPLEGITTRAGPNINVTYAPSPASSVGLHQWVSASRGDHFLDFTCDACDNSYIDKRIEGFAYLNLCPDCIELMLYWDGGNLSNVVTTSDYLPGASYEYIRPIGYALPLSYNGPLATSILELWGGQEVVNGVTHMTYFTLATTDSRTEAQAMNLKLIGQLGRVEVSADSPDLSVITKLASAADFVVIVVATPSSEGSDRPNLDLSPSDDALVTAVTAANPKTAVVLNSPAAIIMNWSDSAGAILHDFFPGQEQGNALADILFGDVNPSGRLPLTIPMSNSDNPLPTPEQYPGVNGTVYYTEKLLIDYRWFDSNNVTPRFPFGHGLSYTTFAYSNLVIDTSSKAPSVLVSFDIKNTGNRSGKEVPQLYLSFPPSSDEPPQLLRGFDNVFLAPGDTQSVSMELTARDMSIWAVRPIYAWQLQSGTFTVKVGASSRDIRLSDTFTL